MKNYNLIYSIGTDCACASYMKMANLRSFSSPFDWLTHADFKTRMNLILNDFENFLNIEDLVFLEKDPNIINDDKCDYYHNIKNDFYFYHDFETGKSLEQTFPTIKEKYNRRIKRFYQTIKENEKILLIWFAHNWETPDDEIIALCKKICEKFDKQIDFLIIEHDENMKVGEVKKANLASNIIIYNLYTRDVDDKGNPTTLGKVENILPLFRQYKLIVSVYKRTVQTLFKYLIKFVPVKKWRKNLRKKYL